ncbi:MAG: PIG-L family deacetylase, partial [Calditrichae bacterium]|nr:PIG-L family deacetylase [Calditrichia bacterium]
MHILAVFAHPDDEAYGPGATLARYAHTGHDVSLITLTHGEDGKLGICKTMKPDEIARMRSEELKCSAKTLGIDYLKIYHFPDRNLMKHPEQEGIEAVAQAIKKLKPDILLTFHP